METIVCLILVIGFFIAYAAAGRLRERAALGSSADGGDSAEPCRPLRDERDMVEHLPVDAPVCAVPFVTAASERESPGHAEQISLG